MAQIDVRQASAELDATFCEGSGGPGVCTAPNTSHSGRVSAMRARIVSRPAFDTFPFRASSSAAAFAAPFLRPCSLACALLLLTSLYLPPGSLLPRPLSPRAKTPSSPASASHLRPRLPALSRTASFVAGSTSRCLSQPSLSSLFYWVPLAPCTSSSCHRLFYPPPSASPFPSSPAALLISHSLARRIFG